MKRLILLLFGCCAFLTGGPAVAQVGDAVGVATVLAVRPLDPAAQAIVASFNTPPTQGRKLLIDRTVRCIEASGVWAKLDVLHVMAAADSQAALLNWKAPGTFNASAVSSPTFTVDRGFTGNGTSSYVDSGFNPATAGGLFAQDSASFALWSETAGQLSGPAGGWFDGTDGVIITPRNASDVIVIRVNNATIYSTANTNGAGFFSVNRSNSGSGNVQAYASGAALSLSGGSASVALNSANLTYGRYSTAGYTPVQLAAAAMGRSMTATEHAGFYACLSPYMTAVGVQ